MKQITLFLFLISYLIQAQFSSPVEYMQKIEAGNNQILEQNWNYLKSIAKDKSARKIEKKRLEILKSIQNSLYNIKQTGAYQGYSAYKDSSIVYLKFHQDLMTGKVKKLINLEEISKKSFDAMEAYILYQRELNKLSDIKSEMIIEEQKKFAKKHNINIVESISDLAEKVKKGNEILAYKQDLFLVFARCQMYEKNLITSFQFAENGINYKENSLLLLDLIDISKNSLDSIKDINSDKSLRNQTLKSLTFFTKEANELVPEYSNFMKLTHSFNKAQKEFEKLPNSSKTQKKVDEINLKVNEFNQATKKINLLLNKYNEERNQVINSWNETANRFLENHIPK